jgi:TonB family protein
MNHYKPSFWHKLKDYLEILLSLKVTEAEKIQYADPHNLLQYDFSNSKRIRVSLVLAILFHILLFLIVFPSLGRQVLIPTQEVLLLRQLAHPAALSGGGSKPKTAPPKPTPSVPKPKPKLVPIPDPTPNAPEPIRKKEIEEFPRLLEEIRPDLNIGEITAPPGLPSRGDQGQGLVAGGGSGPNQGAGSGTGGGGVYAIGSGVTNPQIIVQTTPSYTDSAIKSKVQGIVILQAVIRRTGRVDSFKVIRALGHGLEEQAIQEIAQKWRFRPGTLHGKPVDVLATIEVQFNLR